jgi:xanthine/CO dehydrogenase XdhC/CoxF family maturation factor
MRELKDIIASFDQAQAQGQQTALATVVQVEGSAYRQPGARMLITGSGALTGAISGGCLEGDTLRKAQLAMLQKKNMLITYDTTDEDDAQLGMRLGCNGIIRILIEPILIHDPDNPIALLKKFMQKRQSAALVTLFSLRHAYHNQPGTALLMTEGGAVYATAKQEVNQDVLKGDAREVLTTGMQTTKHYADGFSGLIEFLRPPVALMIFGAGNDAIPLTKFASILGWEITVVDWRASYATPERFPEAIKLIVSKAESALEDLVLDQHTVAILMSHNYNYDLNILRRLLPLNLPYLGSLGPKKKLSRMRDELSSCSLGQHPNEAAWRNVYGPTGLDIGSFSSEEIALSIVSEINKVLSGRNGGSLREKPVVHPENLARLS